MDELNTKIKQLSRYRIEYFLQNPRATKAQFLKDVKGQIAVLVQEIPICPGQQAQVAYYTGKILNLSPEFDPNAVEALNKALRLGPNEHNAWIELGKAAWKNQNIGNALTSFKTAAEKSEDPRTLCYYASALRNQVSSAENKREQLIFVKQSIDLSKKATELDPTYAFGWYSMGNTYLCRFFITSQLDPKDLDRSIDSFNKALQQQPPFINPDLHVNFAEALTYKQNYPAALENLTRAIEIEPHFETALERLDLLRTFLFRLDDCITRKGKMPSKKIKALVNSLEPGRYESVHPNLTHSPISELNEGENPQKFVCLKIVGVISHSNQIPFTMVGVDKNETFAGITVFNFAKCFTALVEDTYTIPAPHLINLKDVKISEDSNITLQLIRVDDPQLLCRNETKLGAEFKAMCNVRFGLQ
ncbi:Tetratricopeptide repeat protein 5-like isoform X2 [Aphelenchoides bicaudatus]|nr:Tetratricopeptide repeat protein 5-like isoform X2 [Aphelenchoides bicaudatus]